MLSKILALLALLVGPAAAQEFNGDRALKEVRAVVAFGPRPMGSPALATCRTYLKHRLETLGLHPEEQAFAAFTPLGRMPVVNLVVRLPGTEPGVILLGGHMDTKRLGPAFVGANDGGSETGVLVELLRVLKDRPRRLTVEVVFFDGEEAVVAWKGLDHTYGSRAFVRDLKRQGRLRDIRAMVNLDMVGDRVLGFPRIAGTDRVLTDLVWGSAKRLGHGRAFLQGRRIEEDDHTPFQAAGIPTIDLIDWEYASWHRPEDTMDKLSSGSLQVVGDVISDALPRLEKRLSPRHD